MINMGGVSPQYEAPPDDVHNGFKGRIQKER